MNLDLFKEGAYGCVFRPGMNCLGKMENSKFITKIQLDKETSDNEIAIGRFIENVVKKDVPSYEYMFAPIISSCELSLGKIKNETIQKCEIIRKNNDATNKFISNKIRYVGKYTLEPFLKKEMEINPITFYKHFFQGHLYLLNSLHILSNYNIIHYDLKQNNISMDDNKLIPVIIDFGLSFRIDDLNADLDYEKYFYIYYDKYPPWCLEINLISFIVNKFKNIQELHESIRQNTKIKDKNTNKKKTGGKIKTGDWKTTIIDSQHLIDIVKHYFKHNYVIIALTKINKKDVLKAKSKWIDFISNELHNKTGEYIVQFLMKSWKSWDNYSLCVIYFFLSHSFFPNNHKDYQTILIDNILAIPLNRDESINTATKINDYIL
jgi:hypothetical protein